MLRAVIARLAAVAVATMLDFRDEVAAGVARIRGEDKEPPAGQHRYDPASVTDCIAERAHDNEPYPAEVTCGDVPHEARFGFTRTPRR